MEPDGHHLEFPDAPRSELERTVEQLLLHAQRVLDTQGRLRNLLRANRAIVEELELEQVLRRVAEAAVSLVGARYGALGVIAPDGTLEQFIHVGMPEPDAEAIGHLPEGHGLLGAVIESGASIRLEHLSDDDRSVGFPPLHPQMDSFLGVPIRVRDDIFGNLYLTERIDGPFTAEDEELVGALAATAGIAIDHARLFDETRRRQRWSAALAEITAALLSDESDRPMDLVLDHVASFVDADLVCLIVPAGAGMLRVESARGTEAEQLEGLVYSGEGTMVARVLDDGESAVIDGQEAGERFPWQPAVGPTIALPLSLFGRHLGALTVSRRPGAARFTFSDRTMASEFAIQVGVAVELAQARRDQLTLQLVEDRNRIARDLHDHVIQRLFGAGLALQSLAATSPPALQPRLAEQVTAIDDAIAQIRTAVFALQTRPTPTPGLRHKVLDVVAEVGDALPAGPRLSFSGAVDLLVDDELASDVVAVVREGLTNVARHAQAENCSVSVSIGHGQLSVSIEDDGVGYPGEPQRSSGTANLRERARNRGGDYIIVPGHAGGTRAEWTVPFDGGQ